MSIKIWWANLIKRYINWQSIKKVMYNWQQIWGEWIIPPPVDYHIIWDFTWWMPNWWISTWGSVSGGWLRNWGARWNQMPDLTNAIRIKIVYNIDVDWDSELSWEIKRGDNTYYGTTMGNDGWLTQNLHSLFFPYENTSETFTSFPAWTYIITADMDLLALTAIQELECPPLGHVENSEISITQEDVNLIRTWKVFDIFANASTVVHKIDFYVRYWHSEQQWIPEGYAMPTASAYEELTNKLNELNVPQYDWYKMLHMPLVGYWSRDSTDRVWFWTSTFMRTLSPSTGGGSTSWHITTGSANIFRNDWRGYWQPVRAFKDQYIAPDNTWTVEWWSLWWAWIFWNQRLWLISITDWNDFNLTMSDKNLWATIAWSYWDELVDANCWLYYQWWNCYWFSFTWWFTTDTQCVDTTGYWYWNYYSRAVYVFGTDWSCSPNDALWDPNPYVPVTWLIFQEAWQTITLQPWQTYQLHASVTPSNASNQRILYSQWAGALYFSISPTWLISIPSGSSGGSTTIDVNTVEWWFSSSCNLVIDTPYIPISWIAVNVDSNIAVPWWAITATVRSSPSNATQRAELRLSENWASATLSTSYIVGDELYEDYIVSIWQDAPIWGMIKITARVGSWGSYERVSIVPVTENVAINLSAEEVPQGSSLVAQVLATPATLSDYISLSESRYGLSRNLTRTYIDGDTVFKYYTVNVYPDANVWSITLTASAWLAETSRDFLITASYRADWTDKDWNIIETDYVSSWETPVFNWTTPSCYDPEEITTEECVFDHWSPTPWPIYADTTYHPVFRNINGPDPDDDF